MTLPSHPARQRMTAPPASVDAICDAFEDAWREGRKPRIEDYLSRADSDQQAVLLRELRLVAWELRRRAEDSQGRSIDCPHCHSRMELRPVDAAEIVCDECGSSFRLEQEVTLSWAPESVRTLGRFQLIEAVGSGAFGTVYKAHDLELDRAVAIKIPRASFLADIEFRDRFLREAKSAARLRHPSIVPVHEVGQHEDTPYLVSDFVEGVTVAKFLSARRLAPREAAELIAELAEALDYAHTEGVIHRDIKPSNVLLDGHRRPHLMDFGLAKRDAGDVTMTMDGQVLGTPAYMSPEQARGEGHQVDGRSDQYSLGAILYQLLTGEMPFRGTTRMLLYQVLHDEPRRPRSLNDRIPRDLETICLKAMAKEPGRRYATAGELAADLRRYLAGEPIRARRVTHIERAWRWCKRNKALSGLAAAFLLALTLGTVIASWQAYLALAGQRLAEAREMEASWNAYVHRARAMARHWEEAELGQLERMLREPVDPDLRGWEWYVLREQFGRRVHSFPIQATGMDLPSNSVAFSPDGRHVATIGDAVEIWDCESKVRLQQFGDGWLARCLDWSPDGGRLAVGTEDERLLIWNTERREIDLAIEPDRGVRDRISCVVWDPDGTRLATSARGRLRLWDGESGRFICELWDGSELQGRSFSELHNQAFDYMYGLSWHCDGQLLASSHRDGYIRVWNVSNGSTAKLKFERRACEIAARIARWSPNGKYLLGGGGPFDFALYVWDADGNLVHQFENVGAELNAACFSPDSRYIASGGMDHSIRIWDLLEKRQLSPLKVHAGSVNALAWNPRTSQIATAGSDVTVKLFDSDGTHGIAELWMEHPSSVRRIAWSPQGDRLAAAMSDGTVQVFDAFTGAPTMRLLVHQKHVRGFDLRLMTPVDAGKIPRESGTGVVIIAKIADKLHFRIIDQGKWHQKTDSELADQQEALEELEQQLEPLWSRTELPAGEKQDIVDRVISLVGPPPINDVTWSPTGDELASIDSWTCIRVWDSETGRQRREFMTKGMGYHTQVAWSPDGEHLACADEFGNFDLFSAEAGESITSNFEFDHGNYDLAWAPDGSAIAAGGSAGRLVIWSPKGGPLSFKLPSGKITDVAWRPDSAIVAAATEAAGILFVDAASGEEVYRLRGHAHSITSIAWSGDGRRIATGSADGEVKIWDAAALVELASFRVHDGDVLKRGVASLAWSPDSSRLASSGKDGRVFVWGSANLRLPTSNSAPDSARILPLLVPAERLQTFRQGKARLQPARAVKQGAAAIRIRSGAKVRLRNRL